jgi:glycosyltransferase involved in cell wall biosynthesis
MTLPPLKLLYIASSLDVGGAETHLARVLPRLAKLSFQPTVYTLTHPGKLAPLLEAASVEVFAPPFALRLRGWPRLARQAALALLGPLALSLLILRRQPDILHFFLPVPYVLGGWCSLLTGKRIRVMSRRGLNRYQAGFPLLARLEKWLHPRMDAVLGNSRAVVEELAAEGAPRERLGLLYNGIDLEAFADAAARAATRAVLGVDEDAPLLLCVANLLPYKGHADLLQALSAIQADLPANWRLALAGRDDGIGAQLRELTQELGLAERILWLGERGDIPALYLASDIGVLCSHEEGFSNSLLEGMAAGVAMIATDVGGNAEAVIDGVTGLVVPPRNPSALSQAILRLASDAGLRKRMGAAGRRRVAERFSLEACVARYARLYQALAEGAKASIMDILQDAARKECKIHLARNRNPAR